MKTCENCGAQVTDDKGGRCDGTFYCCVHCAFHPLGCRCKHGEFGIQETQPPFEDEEIDELYFD